METDKTKTDQQAKTHVPDTPEQDVNRTDGDAAAPADMPRELNGPKGPEPTRYGDWEQKGRCSDF